MHWINAYATLHKINLIHNNQIKARAIINILKAINTELLYELEFYLKLIKIK